MNASTPHYTVGELIHLYRYHRREQLIDGRIQRRSAWLALFLTRGDIWEIDKHRASLGMPVSAWYRATFLSEAA